MAVTANIKFVQGVLTPPAGQALIGVAGVPVTASNEDSSNVETMTWDVVDVPPTSAVATGIAHFGAPQDFIFNPDQPGGYFIHLTVTDLAGNRADSYLVFQIAEPSGYVIPPFMATAPTLNFSGQTRGWAKYIEELLRFLLSGAVTFHERCVFGTSTFTSNDSSAPFVLATMAVDPNVWPATIGTLNRVVTLKATVYTDDVAAAPVVLMRDLTGGVDVGTIAPATSLTPDEYELVLTVGASPGDVRDDVVHMYEWRLYRDGGTVADKVFAGNVRIEVTYV